MTISLAGVNCQQLLMEWRWLVPESASPLWLNAFGDWAFKSSDGRVLFLDLLEGSFGFIAPSEEALDSLFQSEKHRNRWLLADWVGICKGRNLFLSDGQSYGWKVAPVLGGGFEFSNIEVFDIAVYECIMGQIHRQTQAFPKGTVITEFMIGDGSK